MKKINKEIQTMKPDQIEQISDGYHTFKELYEHRTALFMNLVNIVDNSWKSKYHSDGERAYDGWFILAGLILIPASTTYLAYGGRKSLTADKLLYAILAFMLGLGLLIGGVMP